MTRTEETLRSILEQAKNLPALPIDGLEHRIAMIIVECEDAIAIIEGNTLDENIKRMQGTIGDWK